MSFSEPASILMGVFCGVCGAACADWHHEPLLESNLSVQLITATDDGKEFDDEDAQLVLDQGSAPRFYIMRLPRRGLTFERITYHANVTQCLGEALVIVKHAVFRTASANQRFTGAMCTLAGSVNPEPWYLVVAEPTGSVQRFPQTDDLHAFRVCSSADGVFVILRFAVSSLSWIRNTANAQRPHVDCRYPTAHCQTAHGNMAW